MAWRAGKVVWAGRIITGLIAALFIMSAISKFTAGPEVLEGLDKIGLPKHLLRPIAVLELLCVAIYVIPPTTLLGAILMTGYLGGAISLHVRVGDDITVHVILGILIWLGPFLREERLRKLIPLRRP